MPLAAGESSSLNSSPVGAGCRFANPLDGRRDAAVERPETSFAWRGDIALAYQTLGEGSVPILYLQGWPSNVELNWDQQRMARVLRGLARSRKLVVMDVRGNGCSERGTPGDVWGRSRRLDRRSRTSASTSIPTSERSFPRSMCRRSCSVEQTRRTTPTQSRSTSLLSGFRRPSWSSFPAAIDPPGSATRNRCYA